MTFSIRFLCLLILIFLITAAEGRRGSSRSSRSSRSRGGGSSDADCDDDECMYIGIGVGCGVALILLIIGGICLYCHCCRKTKVGSQPWQSNNTFVKMAVPRTLKSEVHDFIFQSGLWNSRYYRNNSWIGPHRISLVFDPQTNKVTGSGTDDQGAFDITDGVYSPTTHRLGLTKTYRSDGSTTSPLPSSQIIQLTWDATLKKFSGKWYDTTSYFKSDGDFEMTLWGSESDYTYEKH